MAAGAGVVFILTRPPATPTVADVLASPEEFVDKRADFVGTVVKVEENGLIYYTIDDGTGLLPLYPSTQHIAEKTSYLEGSRANVWGTIIHPFPYLDIPGLRVDNMIAV